MIIKKFQANSETEAIMMAKNDLCNKIKDELRHTIDVDIPDEVIE